MSKPKIGNTLNPVVEARWCGEWKLFVNGHDVSEFIPYATHPMETIGVYNSWFFDDDDEEVWGPHEEGLPMGQWIEANDYWLESITTLHSVKEEIFLAFQKHDWRHGEGDGCI